MRYYVVSDVHGFCSEMKEALRQKGYFDDPMPHKLIVCGDLLDRGGEALEMQEWICDLLTRQEVILIRGNHEDLILELVENIDEWLDYRVTSTHHFSNGAVGSILQLTGMNLSEAVTNRGECARLMKKTPLFTTIIPNMRNYYETKNYVFVHGWVPCKEVRKGRESISAWDENWRDRDDEAWVNARWSNGMALASQGFVEPNKTIVCGHVHCSYGHAKLEGDGEEMGEEANFEPYYAQGIIAIDACTAYSHKVNCIVIEDEDLVE
ncbi:MAG: metallophosphoesterase [Christensenellales bacterium]